MSERCIQDVAVPLEILQELLGLPGPPVGASFSSTRNTLYLRVPATDKYTRCFSAKVRDVTKGGATVELYRFTLDPTSPSQRGQSIPATDYFPQTMGELTFSTEKSYEHKPNPEYADVSTDPAWLTEKLALPEGAIDQVVVNEDMVFYHDKVQGVWVSFPARNLPCR